jgi:hypothetical protein
LQQLQWYTGVEGRHHRYTIELLVPGKRQGIMRLLGDGDFLARGLPALPPDINGLLAFNIHPKGAIDEIRNTAQRTAQLVGANPVAVGTAIYAGQIAATAALGVDIQHDLLDSLGSTAVVYSSPSEGPLFLGSGLAIEVRDSDKLRDALSDLEKAAVNYVGTDLQIHHRKYHGIDASVIRYKKGDNAAMNFPAQLFAPTYTIHNGWFVVALNPQVVEGYIMRSNPNSNGNAAANSTFQTWKPSPLYEEALAKARQRSSNVRLLAAGESDPRPAMRDILALAPLIASAVNNSKPNTFDNWLIPNAQAVVEPMYPNVFVVFDTGDSLRMDGYKSAPFPFDSSISVTFFTGYLYAVLRGF